MNYPLYLIKEEIIEVLDEAIDPETGEVKSEEAKAKIGMLELAREQKIEAIACLIKNKRATTEAIKIEKQNLAKRQAQEEKSTEWLEGYLASCMWAGEKFQTGKCAISWRKSQAVRYAEDFDVNSLDEEYKKVKVEPSASAIKEALKNGVVIEGCELETRNNIQIK